MTRLVVYSADAEGVGWIVFDNPAARANLLTDATRMALADALTEAARDARLRGLVITSGKERIFIAGADLEQVAGLSTVGAAAEFSRQGQELFARIAAFRLPVVCAIHGACAGGGFELALACHWRIATDADVTQLGLPETSIGTIPGWGGCVRLPRLIGAKPALDHILRGQLMRASEARLRGLVHEVVAVGELRARARAAALTLAREGPPVPMVAPADVPGAFDALRAATRSRTRGHLPALEAAIDVVERSVSLTIDAALAEETRAFAEVTTGATCKNLIRAFRLREAARRRTLAGFFETERPTVVGVSEPRAARDAKDQPAIQRVGVIGAGVMGSAIAQWLAVRGHEVVLRDVTTDLVDRGVAVIRQLTDDAVKRGAISAGEANTALSRVAGTTDWVGFAECDLVIEAIVEDVRAKQALFSELATIVRADALLASNTSALPIEEIAGHVPNPARTVGIHFFNPVGRMPLVELILSRHTSAGAAQRALEFVRALGKLPVVCRSSPGFLVTRVLFFYLNAAVHRWEAGLATTEIDEALRGFGWPMGPLRLIDEVGVDVTDFIFGEMAHYFPDRFVRSRATAHLLAANLRGRKHGASRGFYRYQDGTEAPNDAETRALLRPEQASQPRHATAEPGDLVGTLMRVMADEAERCLAEGVVQSADDVDFALMTGAAFPAFRGGLLHWARGPSAPR